MKKLITNIEPSKQVKATVVCIAALLLSTSWQVASAHGTSTHAAKHSQNGAKPTPAAAGISLKGGAGGVNIKGGI